MRKLLTVASFMPSVSFAVSAKMTSPLGSRMTTFPVAVTVSLRSS
jgi:hypothetical protein